MQNKTSDRKSLKLNKDTLASLSRRELVRVVGGATFCLGCKNGGTGLMK